jgi:glycosyltransferase involved in cell wall biosynthesis
LEYLALGVPVVASDLPGTRTAIGDLPGVTLVTPGESAPLAAAIDETLANPASRRDARQAAREVRRDLVWPTDRVRAYYRSLVSA